MAIVRWNPFQEIDQFFDRHLYSGRPGGLPENDSAWRPLADIRETKDAYRVEVELPAVEAKDVNIELNAGMLHVIGERRYAKDDETDRVHHRERGYGRFARSFRLPEDADADAIRATAKDGVVTITVGKNAKALSRSIAVETH